MPFLRNQQVGEYATILAAGGRLHDRQRVDSGAGQAGKKLK
jgi:hypothetical protein